MSRTCWLRSLKSSVSNSRLNCSTRQSKPNSARLGLELLEDRTVPSVAFDWVNAYGVSNTFYQGDYGSDVVVESSGNLLQAGTIDGKMMLREVQASDGAVLMSSPLSATSGRINQAVVSPSGQIYVAGQTPVDYADIFIAEINPANGQVIWSRTFGSGGGQTDILQSLALDSQGNLYAGGYFRNTVDFGNGFVLTANAGSDGNGYVWKLDSSGQTQWAYRAGGGSGVVGIVIDANDHIFAGGSYSSSQNYFGGASNATTLPTLGAADAYLARYTTGGDLVWTKHWGGASADSLASVAMDSTGNLLAATFFSGAITLDPNNLSSFPITNPKPSNVAISKLDSNGNLLWGSQQTVFGVGDINYTSMQGLAVDAANNPFAVVNSRTPGSYPEDFDAYIQKLDGATGATLWTEILGGNPSDTRGNGIAINSSEEIYLTGGFTNITDFDPTVGVQARTATAGNFDSYLLKLSQSVVANQTISFTAPTSPIDFVPSETVTLYATASSGLPVTFSINANSTGTGSISGNVLTVTGAGTFVINANQAGNYDYYAAPQVQQTLVINQPTAQQQIALLSNQVNALVTNGPLNSGNGNALDTKLTAAIRSLDAGNTKAGVNQLNAFINQVSAFVKSHRLSVGDAELLINAVDNVIASL